MPPLTTFIETVPLLTRPSGIANYVAGLLQEYARRPEAVCCLTGLASGRPGRQAALAEYCCSLAPDIRFVRLPCPNRVAAAWPRLASLTARPLLPQVDIAHATANSFSSWLPPRARARVLTIHDVVFLRHRGGTLCSPDLEAAMSARLPADCRRADLILTDSEFSKREICELLRLPSEKVAVAHLASSLACLESEGGSAVGSLEPEGGPYLLYVGSIDPRKNIATLLAAFAAFRQSVPAARLVMVGRPAWKGEDLAAAIRSTPGVHWLPGCDAQVLAALYRHARGLFLVSWYEGFGLPVLEAMTLGCPVCYGTGSSMGEIAGNTGIAVRPDDRDSIVGAMHLFWSDDSRCRQLRECALAQAARFSWARTAAATLTAYRKALASRN
jgi:glycosyltransferase involved in cell wall biosynthesis